jgi:hypothetical protein
MSPIVCFVGCGHHGLPRLETVGAETIWHDDLPTKPPGQPFPTEAARISMPVPGASGVTGGPRRRKARFVNYINDMRTLR